MTSIIKTKSNILVIIFLLIFLFSSRVWAADSQIAVSTMSIDVSSVPGQNVSTTFTVYNLGDEIEEVYIDTGDWDYDFEGNNRILPPLSIEKSLANWLQITPSYFVLDKGEQKRVELSINIPHEEVGPYWGLAFVKNNPKLTGETEEVNGRSTKMYASQTYAIKVNYTDVNNNQKEGKIVKASVNYDKNSLLNFETVFENLGNSFLEPKGKIEIINEDGQQVDVVNIKKFMVLPGYKRKIQTPYNKDLSAGNYVAIFVLDYNAEELIGAQLEFEVSM
ncbi:MAG: hypothetical protein ACOCRK_09710 [bacterium]